DPKIVQASDFSFNGLLIAGNMLNAIGSRVTPVVVAQLPGLNTLGISVARIDIAPWGLFHFQCNVGQGNAVAIAALSSQNPGVITTANAVFKANPDIPSDLIANAFQVNRNVIYQIQSRF
ncbi:unnamed protein product, partial [Ilex paraguariensis]